MGIIKVKDLIYEYTKRDEEGNVEGTVRAVDGVNLDVRKGEFIAVLGHNGSGKSTMAKHINAILTPTEGTVWVAGMDTSRDENIWDIRQSAGMVFQNPDNQIIGTIVEEDVGFGPENIGIPTEDIWKRVDGALRAVGMTAYRHHSPNKLSGGQKQRVAIAGVVAMRPQCIVLDEPTAMLDPMGRKEVISTVRELNEKEHVTVILITHYMEEVICADRVIVMDDGKVVMQGFPQEIFSQVEKLKEYRLDVPQITELAYELKKEGLPLTDGILTTDKLVNELCQLKGKKGDDAVRQNMYERTVPQKTLSFPCCIKIENLNYIYGKGTAYEIHALRNVNFEIGDGEFIGLIGHTGSGKSTLIQHLNGLIKADSGSIHVDGENIYDEGYSMRGLRSKVGLVFQYPEHQLFETDVFSDVCFGPKNQGLSKEEIEQRARKALESVGLPKELYGQSPFELSGGQKRRAAIAGVLAMEPKVLILDEPMAGLDPKGRDEILEEIDRLHRERGITIILVSHSMEDMANYADRLIVMNKGSVQLQGTPREVFSHYKELEDMGLAAPQITYLMHELRRKGFAADVHAVTVDEAKDEILRCIKGVYKRQAEVGE